MKKVTVIFLTVVLSLTLLSGCGAKGDAEQVTTVNPDEVAEPVEVQNLEIMDIAVSQTLSGKLSPMEDVTIIPEVPAKVTSVKVKLGDKVKKGQVLFTLNDKNIRDSIEQAEAGYNLTKKNLESQKEKIDNAKVNFERMEMLYKEGAISKQQYEQAKIGASDTLIESLQAQVNQAKVSLDQARRQLDKAVITSPVSGYAVAINVEENEFASTQQPAMRVVNTDKLKVNMSVSEQIINKVYKGQEVDINVKVATDETLKGKVTAVSPVPDAATQVFPVEVEIENKDNLLKAGMFAEIMFNIEESKEVLAIPSDAIMENGKSYVFLVKDNIAKKQEIEVGLNNGKHAEVKSGLSKEDKVIVSGQDYVEDGQKVRIVRGDK